MSFRTLFRTLALFAILGSHHAAHAGQIELFSSGSPDFGLGRYAGSIGFGVSNNGVVAATTNLGAADEIAFTYTTGGAYYVLNESGRALAISGDGTRAVGYAAATGAMSWETGTQNLVTLGGLPGYTQASAISRNGAVAVGVAGVPQMASWNAADGSGGTAYDNLGGNFGWAGGISDNGIVGGSAATASARAAVTAIVGVPNSTTILGQGFLDPNIPNPYGKVLGINTDGTLMIGESDIGAGNEVVTASFIYDALQSNTLVKLADVPGFSNTSANGLSERIIAGSALVVGNAWNEVGGIMTDMAAVIWDPTSGAHLLADYAAANWGVTLPAGFTLLTAYGISADGIYITGSAADADGRQVGYLITGNPIPEPASMISLAVGAGIVLLRRRKSA